GGGRRRFATSPPVTSGSLSGYWQRGSSSTNRASTSVSPGSSYTPTGATRSTIEPREAPARDDVLPARRRRWSAEAPQVRHPPAGARDRDARARTRRPEMDPRGRRAAASDAGVDSSRALSRTALTQARGRSARPPRARPREPAGTVVVAA